MKALWTVLLTLGLAAVANAQQVSSSTCRKMTLSPYSQRDDGFCATTDGTSANEGKTIKFMENGRLGIVPGSLAFTATFTEGASKGLQGMQADGTALDSTAAVLNYLYYSGGFVGAYMTVVDAGATVPAATAGGLDLAAGTNNDNDHFELYTGILGASGRPYVVGTDPAVSFCATIDITDVSDTDFMQVGWRDATPVVASAASYTVYASIGIGAGDGSIYTDDKTAGGVDTTDDWADGASKELCVLISAAGVVTYTVDGVAPTVATAYTFADGVVLVPFWAIRNAAATPDPFELSKWEVSLP